MADGDVMLRDNVDSRRWWTLSVLCLSLLMVVVGNTALNVAIPTLVRDIHATDTQLQWIVDAYSLVFAGLLLTCGALGDRFGRKGALTIGLCIFGTGSFLAGISDTPNQLIVCRAIMGMGGAFVMPATLSILTNIFPVHERARAIAIWDWRNPHPMLDLNFFKRKRFTGGATAITLVFFGLFGMFFLITQYLQFVHGWTPLGAGVRLLPFAVVMGVVAPLSARIAERIGTKTTVATGLAVASVGLFIASRP